MTGFQYKNASFSLPDLKSWTSHCRRNGTGGNVSESFVASIEAKRRLKTSDNNPVTSDHALAQMAYEAGHLGHGLFGQRVMWRTYFSLEQWNMVYLNCQLDVFEKSIAGFVSRQQILNEATKTVDCFSIWKLNERGN
ncbi:hypothetical protein FSHL1_009511 [Fusarium sambucinum]